VPSRTDKRRALVVGGAACVWRDTANALALFEPDLIVVVNSVGTIWPWRIDVWCSYHADKLKEWSRWRVKAGLGKATELVTTRPASFPDTSGSAGSSGFLGLCVALDRVDEAVLAGIPMSTSQHWNGTACWEAAPQYRGEWMRNASQKHIRGRAWSMSGWTLNLLGAP
jgi:hypothetical protein